MPKITAKGQTVQTGERSQTNGRTHGRCQTYYRPCYAVDNNSSRIPLTVQIQSHRHTVTDATKHPHCKNEPVPLCIIYVMRIHRSTDTNVSDLRIQTYMEPVPLKYGKLAQKCPWIFSQCINKTKQKKTDEHGIDALR